MKTKEDFIVQIRDEAQQIKRKIENFSQNIIDQKTLLEFYDKCLPEFYRFMPYYCFMLPFNHLSEQEMLEINQFGLDKRDDIHSLYSGLYRTNWDKYFKNY